MIREIFKYAKEDFSSFLGDTSIIALLLAGGVFLLKMYFTNTLQKKLEMYKVEMNSKIEEIRHKQQRVFKEFDLYTTKRYEVYPQLHNLMQHAYSKVIGLRTLKYRIDYNRLSVAELEEYLKENNYGEQDSSMLLELFSKDRSEGVRAITKAEYKMDYQNALKLWDAANNYLILNELYLTEEAFDATKELIKLMHEFWMDVNPANSKNQERTRKIEKFRVEILPLSRDKFKGVFLQDLRRSFST